MSRKRVILGVLLALVGLVVPQGAGAVGRSHESGPAPATEIVDLQSDAPGTLIVAFPRANLPESRVRAVLSRHGAVLEEWLPELGLARVSAPPAAQERILALLARERDIEWATEERYSVRVAEVPPDEYWDQQWGPQKVGLPVARDIGWGHPSTVVAVIDTGVRYTHLDLRDQIWMNPGESDVDPVTGAPTCTSGRSVNGVDDDGNGYKDDCWGYDFDAFDKDPADVHGHGTAVAGILAAAVGNHNHETARHEGIAGMAGAAKILVVRALNNGGYGSPLNIAQAIEYAADEGAQIINLSLTLPLVHNPYDAETLCRATDYAQQRGALVVAATGNEASTEQISYPARCAGVVAVGASTRTDQRALWSNASPRIDMVAPGEGIFSTMNTGDSGYGYFQQTGSGTSFATPHVSGAAALVWSLRPDYSAAQIAELLRETADDIGAAGFDNQTGWGRLNVERAAINAVVDLQLRVSLGAAGAATGTSIPVFVQAVAPNGSPAGKGARVHLSGELGVVSPAVVTLDSTGEGSAMYTAGPSTGVGHVKATLGVLQQSIPVVLAVEPPRALHLPIIGSAK